MSAWSDEERDVLDRWLPEYGARAGEVAGAVGTLMSEAFEAEDSLFEAQQMTESSLGLVRARRDTLPPLILFLYSASFDAALFEELVGGELEAEERAGWEGRFREKAERAGEAIVRFALTADVLAEHYTVALMAPDETDRLPLVWELPALHLENDGVHEDAAWWMSFMLLCELSRAICAYGGFSRRFHEELAHVRQRPELNRKLFWLEGDLRIHLPDDPDHVMPIHELPDVLRTLSEPAG